MASATVVEAVGARFKGQASLSTEASKTTADCLASVESKFPTMDISDTSRCSRVGRIGKRVTLRVGHLMHSSPNVSPLDGWLKVVKALSKYSLGAVNVVDENERLIGIVTDGDLRRTIEKNGADNLDGLNAEQMMTKGPVTATPEMLAFDALHLMENRPSQISVLPVVDESGICKGLLRLHDIVRSGL